MWYGMDGQIDEWLMVMWMYIYIYIYICILYVYRWLDG